MAESPRQPRNTRNFRIHDNYLTEIGAGGDKQKINRNLDALELLKRIEAEGRTTTPEEQRQLAQYVDFGGLRKLWDRSWEFRPERERLQSILTGEEIDAIKETSLNTHYTSMPVVDGVWSAVRRLGFTGGQVLEPGMGIGNFFGRIPENISANSQLIGVEKNVLSGRIAQALYPDATIAIKPYEQVQMPNESFDLVIGNPPFADIKIFDPEYTRPKLALHNYFIVKSLDKLKPGSIAALITSHYTLDAVNSRAREEMAKRADLVAAIRLPDDAFKKNAGTEVTADILFFRKPLPGEVRDQERPNWIKTVEIPIEDGATAPVNEYFCARPDMILGTHSLQGSMYGARQYTVTPTGDLAEQLARAIATLPENITFQRTPSIADDGHRTEPTSIELAPGDVKENAFFIDDGRVWLKHKGAKTPLPENLTPPPAVSQLSSLVRLREALKDTIRVQMTSTDDGELQAAQTTLTQRYIAYREKYGPLTGPKTARVFRDDPEYPLLTALENIHPDTGQVTRADIFTKRTARPYQPLHDLPNDPKAAMLKVLADRGTLDTALMASLLNQPEEKVVSSLIDAGLIYCDPVSDRHVTADEYLSGNVRVKLHQAESAAELDRTFDRNVAALRDVQPEPVSIVDIDARLGQTWIPNAFYERFIHHLAENGEYGDKPSVTRDQEGRWYVELPNRYSRFPLDHKWNGGGIAGHKLVEYALNQQQPTIYFPPDENGHRDLDAVRTTAARAKLQEIKDEFARWIKSDDISRFHPELEQKYNDLFNGITRREYNGNHLAFAGLNPTYTPRDYQSATVWRIVQEGRALVAHDVGLGKTLTTVMAGMELRRTGLSRKNLYVVTNNMVPQWREDFKKMYPGANVLAVTDKDLASAKNRQRLFARIATNEWDAVIVPQSQFNMLPISPEREAITLRKQLDELEDLLEDHKAQVEENGSDRSDKRTLRQMENAKQKYEQRLKELAAGRKDDTIYFDDLGVDMLFIDEAHAYKALPFATKQGHIAGLSTRQSQRAQNVLAKIDYMFDTHNGRGVVFATGTPITNTLGEQYIMTRYLAPDLLDKAGIRNFDDWCANFAEAVTRMEYATDGVTIRPKTALAQYVNVPELQQLWSQFADVVTQDDAVRSGQFTVPGVIRKDKLVKITPEQEPFLREIAERGEKLMLPRSDPEHPDPRDDNWLKLDGDARDISLDARMRDSSAKDHPDNKTNAAVQITKNALDRTINTRGTVVIFSDRYATSDGKFNLFHDIRDKLIAQGVAAAEIGIVHDYASREQFLSLQEGVRSGRIRVVMGTTEKLGIGVNIQDRLKAAIHVDLPQRPDQVEQREGRIIRYGNSNEQVEVYRLISEPRSVNSPKAHDLQRAQLLERKQTFLTQFKSGNRLARRIEDIAGDVRLSPQMFALAKAQATGNPLAMEKIKLEHEIRQLSLLNRSHQLAHHHNRQELDRAQMVRAAIHSLLPEVQRTHALFQQHEQRDTDGKLISFELTFNGQSFTKLKDANEYLRVNPQLAPQTQLRINGVSIPIELRDRKAHDPNGNLFAYVDVRYNFAGEWHDAPRNEAAAITTAQSLVSSILARSRDLPGKITTVEQQIVSNTKEIERLHIELANKSPYTDKLAEYESRLEEVQAELLKGVKEAEEIGDATIDEESEQMIPQAHETEQEEGPPIEAIGCTPQLTLGDQFRQMQKRSPTSPSVTLPDAEAAELFMDSVYGDRSGAALVRELSKHPAASGYNHITILHVCDFTVHRDRTTGEFTYTVAARRGKEQEFAKMLTDAADKADLKTREGGTGAGIREPEKPHHGKTREKDLGR